MVSAQTVKNLMRHPGEAGKALARRMKRVPVLLRVGRTIKNLLHVNRLAMRVENLEHALAAYEKTGQEIMPENLPIQAEIEELRIALHRQTRKSREMEALMREAAEATIPLRRRDATRREMIGQAVVSARKNAGDFPLQAAVLGRDGTLWTQEGIDLSGMNIRRVKADEDVLSYLRHCQGQSLDLIMMPHVGERMPLAELTESLTECGRVLRSGGALIWEMVEPAASQETYSLLTDPANGTLLAPEVMRLLVERTGLKGIRQGRTEVWREPGKTAGDLRDHILIAFQE